MKAIDKNRNSIKKNITMNNLRKILEEKDCKTIKLAVNTGLSQSTCNAYMNGQNLPEVTNLIKIANYLNCNIDYLLDRTNIPIKVDKLVDRKEDDDFNLLIHNSESLSKEELKSVKAFVKVLVDKENE